jgi:hypothetical protein
VTDKQQEFMPDLIIKDKQQLVKTDDIQFDDFYRDCRTFLQKANSTKFIVVMFILLLNPVLLYADVLPPEVYKEIVLLTTLTYLGVDVYEKRITRKGRK